MLLLHLDQYDIWCSVFEILAFSLKITELDGSSLVLLKKKKEKETISEEENESEEHVTEEEKVSEE